MNTETHPACFWQRLKKKTRASFASLKEKISVRLESVSVRVFLCPHSTSDVITTNQDKVNANEYMNK